MTNPMVYVSEVHVAPLLGPDLPPPAELRIYTAEEFETMTERAPEHDDLDRLNCPDAGLVGHLLCGDCVVHQLPRFMCGCLAPLGAPTDVLPALRVVTDEEYDPCMVGVDAERILGWPGLDAFPEVVARLREWVGTPVTEAMRHAVRQIVQQALYELVGRGALRRDLMRGGAWRYDRRVR
jgi:hypothetical protein